MKKTVKTSRVAGQLEKMYRLLNARFFNGELPEVVISLKKTVGAMVISLAIRSGRQETSGGMKSTSAAPRLAAQ